MSPAAAATHSLRNKLLWPDIEYTPQLQTAVSTPVNIRQDSGHVHCMKETKH